MLYGGPNLRIMAEGAGASFSDRLDNPDLLVSFSDRHDNTIPPELFRPKRHDSAKKDVTTVCIASFSDQKDSTLQSEAGLLSTKQNVTRRLLRSDRQDNTLPHQLFRST